MKRVPTFTRYEDGSITVDDWCREVEFSETFLNNGITNNRSGVVWKPVENTVTIECANGRAVYQLTTPDPDSQTWRGTLIEAEIEI